MSYRGLDYHHNKKSNTNDVLIRMIKSKVTLSPSVSQYYFSCKEAVPQEGAAGVVLECGGEA